MPTNLRQLGAVGRYVPPPTPHSQRVIVAGNIVTGAKMATMGKQQKPLGQYLTQQKGREGQEAALFTKDGQPADLTRFQAQVTKDPHQFRLSISPDPTQRFFPLQPYAEALMRHVEKDLGRPIDWLGAVHRDTAHPHVHIILRGRDMDGKPLYIVNDYLARGMRYRAQQMATWLLGPDRSRAQERRVEPQRTPPQHEPRRAQEMGR